MKKFFISFFVLFAFSAVLALTPNLFAGMAAVVSDDDEDDDEEEEASGEEQEEASENSAEETSSEEDEEEQEDPFAKPDDKPEKKTKEKDEFVQESKTVYPDPEEDDFVVEKREKGVVHHHKEPDLAKVVKPTYLYTEAGVRSKKLFELYKNDDLIILEEVDNFYHVEFLGKEGWVPREDVRLEKWHTYRLSFELSGGVGGGKVNNYDVIGNYTLRLNVSVIQDFIAGLEGRAMSFDRDNLFGGGGLMLRYYIHGIRSRKTRSAISASAGYIGGVQLVSSKKHITGRKYLFSGGPYVSLSLDYFFRVWEYIALGAGGDFTYLKTYSSFDGINKNEELFLGGAHITLMFNVKR